MAERVRILARYSGHVQGVGFRFTAVDVARKYPAVTGFVRNLLDGRVELVAEGPPEQADAFLAAVRSAMDPYIDNVSEDRQPATGEFARFTIAR